MDREAKLSRKALRLFNEDFAEGMVLAAARDKCDDISHVTDLDLRWCKAATDADIQQLVENCHSLKTVDLSYCNLLTNASVLAFAHGYPKLTTVALNRCEWLTDMAIQALAQGCPDLVSVSLEWCEGLTDMAIQALAQGCPGLVSVSLERCEGLTDMAIRALAQGCPKLASVSLSRCGWFSDVGIQALAQGCPKLTTVDLSSCFRLSDGGIKALARGCPNLANVSLSDCTPLTDAGICALAQGCPSLESVSLDWCQRLTDAGIQALARGCPNLSTVHLDRCEKLTDVSIRALAQNCSKLTTLGLSCCEALTDVGIRELAKGGRLDLVSLDLSQSHWLTDDGIQALVQACPNLTTVSLNRCSRVTDVSIQALAQGCPKLTTVDLDGCQKVTDMGARALSERSSVSFQKLHLSGTSVTAPESLIKSCNAQQILQYYRELIVAEQTGAALQIPEVKVLLVGQGESGKTTLRHRALSGQANDFWRCEPHDNRTHDVSMTCFAVSGITYRVWDFGGQDHLHGTHRFFLGADHALYILVLDVSKSPRENRLSYWLRFLAHHGSKSVSQRAPVLIVLNKGDELALATVDSDVARNHRDLQEELEVAGAHNWFGANVIGEPLAGQGWHDSLVGLGPARQAQLKASHEAALANFATAFREATKLVVNLHQEYPPAYFALKEYVAQKFFSESSDHGGKFSGKSWLNYRDESVQQVFQKQGILEAKSQKQYLRFVSDLGLSFFVGDIPEVERGNNTDMQFKVFNPAWVKRPVYSLIRWANHDRGWVAHDEITAVLSQPLGGSLDLEDQNVIRRLMIVCRLGFKIERQGLIDGLLIPDRLAPRCEEQLTKWSGTDLTRLSFSHTFIPDRVFLRFVAAHFEDLPAHAAWFRNEVVISCGGGVEILVQGHLSPVRLELPKIEITARGGDQSARGHAARAIQQELLKLMQRELISGATETLTESELCDWAEREAENQNDGPNSFTTQELPSTADRSTGTEKRSTNDDIADLPDRPRKPRETKQRQETISDEKLADLRKQKIRVDKWAVANEEHLRVFWKVARTLQAKKWDSLTEVINDLNNPESEWATKDGIGISNHTFTRSQVAVQTVLHKQFGAPWADLLAKPSKGNSKTTLSEFGKVAYKLIEKYLKSPG